MEVCLYGVFGRAVVTRDYTFVLSTVFVTVWANNPLYSVSNWLPIMLPQNLFIVQVQKLCCEWPSSWVNFHFTCQCHCFVCRKFNADGHPNTSYKEKKKKIKKK